MPEINQNLVLLTAGFCRLTSNDEVCDVPLTVQENLETVEESDEDDHDKTEVRSVWLERCDVGELASVDALFLASIVEPEVRAAVCKVSGTITNCYSVCELTYMKIEVQVRSPVIDDKFDSHPKTVEELSETFTREKNKISLEAARYRRT